MQVFDEQAVDHAKACAHFLLLVRYNWACCRLSPQLVALCDGFGKCRKAQRGERTNARTAADGFFYSGAADEGSAQPFSDRTWKKKKVWE